VQLRIKELREEKGWNQTILGFYSELSPSQISLIETGKRNPSAETLLRIATALGVEVGDLFPKAQAPSSQLRETEEERRLLRGRVSPWLHLLDRKAERWEQAAAAGRADRSFYQEASADFDDSTASVGILIKDLIDEGFHRKVKEAPAIADIGRELGQRVKRLYKAKEELNRVFELTISSEDELAQLRVRKSKEAAEVKELTKSTGA
jgi:transcriptional regulator with XRE-family HTH domain